MKLTTIGLRRGLGAALAASALALSACGGGDSDVVDPFRPARVLGFGDESTVINADGTKYSINGFAAGNPSRVDCTVNPLWIQAVATAYGFVFPECNPNNVTAPPHRILATVGARAGDLTSQVDRVLNGGGFAAGDISFVFIGVNDVVAQFQRYPNVGEPQLTAELQRAGAQEAAQVNRLADLGSKVVVVTIPNTGLAPIAGGRTTESAALLGRLTRAYNTAMRSNIYNDGLRIGLVLFDEYVDAVAAAADTGNSGVAFVNARDAACAVALPNCTTNTLVSATASATTWLWADNTHLSAGGQASLGSLASSRATTNPF